MDNMNISTELRNIGNECLKDVLSLEKNIKILEKWIFNISNNDSEKYKDIVLETCENISSGNIKLNSILQNLKSKNCQFDSFKFKNNKEDLDEENRFIMNPFEVEEGVLECSKCGSKKTLSYSKQMRGGDEGTTVMATCVNCHNSWKVSS